MNQEIKDYMEERRMMLVNLDIEMARIRLEGGSDAVLLCALHKARYEATDISSDLRRVSGEWLLKNGHARMKGLPLLPPGELP